MLSIGAFAFVTPWLLAGLILLPVIWLVLRVTPPTPSVVRFPAVRLLARIARTEETPARTPWWLLLLRMLLALLLILALAHPVLNPPAGLPGKGPLVLIVDDDWAAAADWPLRQHAMADLLDTAARGNRSVILLPTAAGAAHDAPDLQDARGARAQALRLAPKPWGSDRGAIVKQLAALDTDGTAAVYWLSDGLGSDDEVAALGDAMKRLGEVRVMVPAATALPLVVTPANGPGLALRAAIRRAQGDVLPARQVGLRVTGNDGALLGAGIASFQAGADGADAAITLPAEIRNRAARIVADGNATAGGVLLLDDRARRGSVGVVGASAAQSQPLLSRSYYVERALEPYADLRRDALSALMRRPPTMIVLPDGAVTEPERLLLTPWIEGGGVLLRFAGPELASAADDGLLPVMLRGGGRSIGGSMSWESPARLAPFAANSPFAGLPVPEDVAVARQVLAEPSPDLQDRVWARLSDGTPLVTAVARGQGWIVLVHTTPNAAWSNLALSGLFVDMLRRLADLGVSRPVPPDTVLPPWRMLDGFGALTDPAASAAPLRAGDLERNAASPAVIGPTHPPGYYGTEQSHRALNLGDHLGDFKALGPLPTGVQRLGYAGGDTVDLRPPFLTAALLLAMIDLLVGYGLRGLIRPLARVLLPAALLLLAAPAKADDDARVIEAVGSLHLAYVLTGDPNVDAISKAGLSGLDGILNARTSVDAAQPMAVNPETDELIFYPLIYWPLTDDQKPLSPVAAARIDQYLASGGILMIDTRDAGLGVAGDGDRAMRLQRLLQGVHVPPLTPMPSDHVLTRSFYLLPDGMPGRWTGGNLWVVPQDPHASDGVSSLILGSNDYAAAWAVDGAGNPEFNVAPGGEAQRERAYRFGVNLVMYALTGSYKADQMQVKAILDRLGH